MSYISGWTEALITLIQNSNRNLGFSLSLSTQQVSDLHPGGWELIGADNITIFLSLIIMRASAVPRNLCVVYAAWGAHQISKWLPHGLQHRSQWRSCHFSFLGSL